MIAQFALRLICGMSLAWCVMPRRHVTDGFFRIQMLIVLGLAVLAALVTSRLWGGAAQATIAGPLGPTTTTWSFVCLAVIAYLGSFTWALGRRSPGTVCIGLIAVLSLVLLGFSSWSIGPASEKYPWLAIATELSTSFLLGVSMVAMLLGHWYLTASGMPLAPLSRLTALLGAATMIRLVLAAVGLALAGSLLRTGDQTVMMALRWLAGLLGPLMVVVMVWRILRYRNTQSATGVLYVGVMLTLIGELTATLLSRELCVPV